VNNETDAAFEAITRGVREEIETKIRREHEQRRRRQQRALPLGMVVAGVVVSAIGILNPIIGAGVYVAAVLSLSRLLDER
jgi:hypothetical protein